MQKYLLFFYFTSLVISAVVCFIYRQRQSSYLKILWIYLLLTFLSDSISEILRLSGKKFQYIYIIFGPIEYFFISNIFYNSITNRLYKKFIKYSIPGYGILCIILLLKSSTHYLAFNIRGCLILTMILFYLWELYKDNEIVELKTNPVFWISFGSLFYWCGTFFIVALVIPLNKIDSTLGENLYSITPMLNIFLYGMFSKALTCRKKFTP